MNKIKNLKTNLTMKLQNLWEILSMKINLGTYKNLYNKVNLWIYKILDLTIKNKKNNILIQSKIN
jgi:hypothetical protein